MRATGTGPLRLLVGSFLVLIALGTVLLRLPLSTPADAPIGWIDSLFTATSAVCVTGLIVRDTGTAFTGFGQAVILVLIQLGGLGLMTLSLYFFALVGGRVSMAQRSLLERTMTHLAGAQLPSLLGLVVRFTLLVEGVAALLLWPRFWIDHGALAGLWHAVFHSVSAFCNAGFSLWSDSLVAYRGDPLVNGVVMAEIVLGGLGFFVVWDLWQNRPWRRRPEGRLSTHSRLALVASAVLIVLGAAAFWLLEARWTLAGLGPVEQLLASLFQSVTTRTAGFNSVDIAALTPATLFVLVLLMFVGGSPGSCAGGIKTTTAAVLVVAAWNQIRGRRHVNVFRRTLSERTVGNTLSITLAGAVVMVVGLFALLLLEAPHQMVREDQAVFFGYLFETVSALGTVGLSTGTTGDLQPASRLLVSLFMFLGRLGPLTVATALARTDPVDDWRYPREDVMVG